MKFIACEQGSREWLQVRSGVATASCFADAVSVLTRASGERQKGDPTGASDRYASDLAIERISGKPYGEPPKAWLLARGHELEPLARAAYERRTGHVVEEAGVCLTDDGIFGYSTDGLVNLSELTTDSLTCEGLIEVKCPIDSQKILEIWRTGDLSEYQHQMQGGMWITGARWVDFLMFVPELASVGRDLYVQRVQRDEAFITTMEFQLLAFNRRVEYFKTLLSAPANEAELRKAA